ncbi:hypothetical protein SISSUDRAFT_994234 [Sistotremastrum suecicum HHB10207 ss-3]|uniref:Uncharacterized protein n=1 Tax=Sistotremastrum suecicum HHB10207 ss-3 TaxID=1314776 RepID=A0A165XKP0_9AGAM|nr:hypothetical protein SISSUDRAFT_994234 [Sistotremastrum suecicum HHB10207 ss-3]
MTACCRLGYHPTIWREAVAVALQKPGKKDYSIPRAYRLIQLLDCLLQKKLRIIYRSSYDYKGPIVVIGEIGGPP